jgi:hypothetical protein
LRIASARADGGARIASARAAGNLFPRRARCWKKENHTTTTIKQKISRPGAVRKFKTLKDEKRNPDMRPVACRGVELIDYQASCERSPLGFLSPPQMMQRRMPHIHLREDGPPSVSCKARCASDCVSVCTAGSAMSQEARRQGKQAARCRRSIRGTLVNSALGVLPFDAMHDMMVHYSILLGGKADRAKTSLRSCAGPQANMLASVTK